MCTVREYIRSNSFLYEKNKKIFFFLKSIILGIEKIPTLY